MRERSSASPSERLDRQNFPHFRFRRGQPPPPPPQPHPNVAAPGRAAPRPKSPLRRSNPPTPLEVAAKIARKSGNQPLTIQTVAHPALRATFPRKGGRGPAPFGLLRRDLPPFRHRAVSR